MTTVAKVTKDIRRGVLFMPVTDRRINYLTHTHDLLDADSKEPNHNHTAVAIRKV